MVKQFINYLTNQQEPRMTEYRTEEQFHKIMESAINGNWLQAYKECVEYGFYAQDLIRMHEETGEVYGYECTDLVYLSQGAAELRAELRFDSIS
jgi:hypothetical protein